MIDFTIVAPIVAPDTTVSDIKLAVPVMVPDNKLTVPDTDVGTDDLVVFCKGVVSLDTPTSTSSSSSSLLLLPSFPSTNDFTTSSSPSSPPLRCSCNSSIRSISLPISSFNSSNSSIHSGILSTFSPPHNINFGLSKLGTLRCTGIFPFTSLKLIACSNLGKILSRFPTFFSNLGILTANCTSATISESWCEKQWVKYSRMA
mmetsp:Transcript_10653/g.15708  ORF Transcript_10653/g.15708 Transcript_10653/m.15708 type:complete len:202 (-) Transcript_10653:947-1552(-)